MSNLFKAEHWTLTVPKGWVGEWDDDIAQFYGPDDVGALQISEFQKSGAHITDDELLEFIDEVPLDQVTLFSSDGFTGFHFRHAENETHWKKWLLRNANVMLFVTYNCDIEDADFEEQDVLRAVASITPHLTHEPHYD